MRKKLVSVLLVAAMGVSVLAGCGSSSGNEGDKKASGDENVHLRRKMLIFSHFLY